MLFCHMKIDDNGTILMNYLILTIKINVILLSDVLSFSREIIQYAKKSI